MRKRIERTGGLPLINILQNHTKTIQFSHHHMSNLKKRNSEIIQTRNKGATYQEIADLFGLSRERVRQIILRSELEKKQRLQSEKILAILRATDDINKKWPTNFLVDGFQFPKKTTWALNKYFERHNIIQLSLLDLMNLLIAEKELHETDLWMNVPALKEKWMGRKTYASLVEYLSKYDLGHNFNTEWGNRIKKLKRYAMKNDMYVFAALRKYNGKRKN
jgi:hypothetical protein